MLQKLWTLLVAMTNNPPKNIWDEFIKTSKIGPSMESLNADFLQFFAKKKVLLKVLFLVAV